MSGFSRIGVAIDSELLDKFDCLIGSRAYTDRPEVTRDLIRELVPMCESPNSHVVSNLSTLHVYLDHDNCRGSVQSSRCTYQHQGRVVRALYYYGGRKGLK
jgi:metal-responsive CopG/Arc/MetJ family transcriptional regulator